MLGLTFLTPVAALVGLVGLVPLIAWALGRRRGARVARALQLPTGVPGDWLAPGALVALSLLLALAAAQPVRARTTSRDVRTDAEALYVIDTSPSMRAASRPHAPDRLAQARRIALAMREAMPEVPAGVASFTDRVLPDLFPSADASAFASTVRDAIRIDAPPPRDENVIATTFDALGEAAHSGFFQQSAKRRVLVVVSDGESRAFDAAGLARTLAASPATQLVAIRVGGSGDRIWQNGKADPAYTPEAGAARSLQALTNATDTPAADAPAGVRAVRAALGRGPVARQGTTAGRSALAPYLLALALVPLGALLLVRNFS
ncbi:MAG: hypothetical protein QOF54_805 [Solirubrobacteraceae bacterium]|nr:hypothetical protein [Solirubrobacteraceae bacterium]